jgi:hypothetical protein
MPFSRRNSTPPLRFWFPVSVPLAFILTKSTFLRQTASIGVSHMSAEGAVCGLCACPRNDPTSPTCRDATAFAMLTKLGTSCNPDDVIKCAHFCYDRYGGISFCEGSYVRFSDSHRMLSLNTAWCYRAYNVTSLYVRNWHLCN